MQSVRGSLIFGGETALPPTAVAHVTIVPISATTIGASEPVAQGNFPAKTGESIPFSLKFPKDNIAGSSDYFVLAQVIDHGRVWYSNLSSPLRVSFLAEPGDLTIPLRREGLRMNTGAPN